MTQSREILEQIDKLDPVEREQLLFVLSREFLVPTFSLLNSTRPKSDDHPTIVETPNVCGGAARFVRTRIPIWTIERMRQLGLSESDILRSFPTLQARDLVEAWSYVQHHREEIEAAIRENEEQ